MKSPSSRSGFFLFGIIALMVALVFAYVYPATPAAPVFPHGNLLIQRADGKKFPLAIEIASTPAQTEHGLMFRRSLPPDTGMLFLFTPDRPASFWMKNTYIPLDMLFVRADGTIVKIAARAVPFSLAPIDSDQTVRGVIEINGGAAKEWGLKTGDKVLFPAFSGR